MKVSMDAQIGIRKMIEREFGRLKNKNPSFSMRAFARRVNWSASGLSEVMNGKRGISKSKAMGLVARLNLDHDETEKMLSMLRSRPTAKGHQSPKIILSPHDYQTVSEWQHWAILSLMETKSFRSDVSWIADRLGITFELAQRSLDTLLRLGFVHLNKVGGYEISKVEYFSPDGSADLAIRKTYSDHLRMAEQALQKVPVELRDFSSMTMAISPAKLPAARKMLRQFRKKMSKFLEAGAQEEVYLLDLFLYPVSAGVKK